MELIALGNDNSDISNDGRPVLAKVSATNFIENPQLREEVFGPFTLFVQCANPEEFRSVVKSFEGQLTISVMATDADLQDHDYIVALIQEKAGRIVFNGVPTGVEVCHSMHHGGPYPASSNGKYTSVGSDAIKRFARPVCFQNAPEAVLPVELQNSNPRNIWRHVDGQWTRNGIDL